jgi:O-antigen ligase
MTRSQLLAWWMAPDTRDGILQRRVISVLGSPLVLGLFLGTLAIVAVWGALQGDLRFTWLGAVALLGHWLIRRESGYGFFLLGLAWVLATKVPLPWSGWEFAVIRADDILVVLLLTRFLQDGKWASSPLDKPIVAFLGVALLSMILGLWTHCIDRPFYSFLNFLKWGEYFLLCSLAFQMPNPLRGMCCLLGGMAVAGSILIVHGIVEHLNPLAEVFIGNYYRIFERPPFIAKANHFGMFLVICLSFALPFFLHFQSYCRLGLLLVWTVGASFVMYWTYSRMSYFALAFSLATISLVGKSPRLFLIALCLLLAPIVLSERVWDRVMSVPSSFEENVLSSSMTARFSRWQILWDSVRTYPILGTGIGSRNRIFYESFWIQLLCETGLIGAVLYLGILLKGALILLRDFRERVTQDPAALMLLGFVGVFIAMMADGFILVNFIITVVAAPFWTSFGFLLRSAQERTAT